MPVQALTEDGQTALAIDHGGEADLHHELLAGVGVADVGGGQLPIAAEGGQGSTLAQHRRVGKAKRARLSLSGAHGARARLWPPYR